MYTLQHQSSGLSEYSIGDTKQSGYSVITPSMPGLTRATKSLAKAAASNPNPQGKGPAFIGVRQMNPNDHKDILENAHFTKKMVFGQQDNNHDVLRHHLQMIRNH